MVRELAVPWPFTDFETSGFWGADGNLITQVCWAGAQAVLRVLCWLVCTLVNEVAGSCVCVCVLLHRMVQRDGTLRSPPCPSPIHGCVQLCGCLHPLFLHPTPGPGLLQAAQAAGRARPVCAHGAAL